MSLKKGSYVADEKPRPYAAKLGSDMGSEGCLLFGTKTPRLKLVIIPEYGTASLNAHAKLSFSMVFSSSYQNTEIHGQTKK